MVYAAWVEKTNRSILPASERRAKFAWAMPNQAGDVSNETILKSEVQTSDSMKKDERPGQSKLAFRGFGLGRWNMIFYNGEFDPGSG